AAPAAQADAVDAGTGVVFVAVEAEPGAEVAEDAAGVVLAVVEAPQQPAAHHALGAVPQDAVVAAPAVVPELDGRGAHGLAGRPRLGRAAGRFSTGVGAEPAPLGSGVAGDGPGEPDECGGDAGAGGGERVGGQPFVSAVFGHQVADAAVAGVGAVAERGRDDG